MGSTGQTSSDQKRRRSDQVRLESWKAIAAYLNRSVRTVRRWEASENLPIHRHHHTKGSSVYAFSAELDAWRHKNDLSVESEPSPARESAPSQKHPAPSVVPTATRYAAVAVVAASLGSLAGYTLRQPDGPDISDSVAIQTSAATQAWVLVSATVNQSQSGELGNNFRAALLRDVSRDGSNRVLPRETVERALELMRQDPGTVPDPAVAREIAVRQGQVSALLVPRIEKLGESFVLSVEVTDPSDGRLIAYPSETIESLRSALPAFERLSGAVNSELARHHDIGTGSPLPTVTTRSTVALRLYSQGYELLSEDRPAAARELLALAVGEDAEFASALALQAWAMRRSGDATETYLAVSGEAAQHADKVSPQERFFIDGTYNHFTNDVARAEANFRALLAVQPDHLFGAEAVLELCVITRHPEGCVADKVRVARLRPDNLEANIEAAWSLAAHGSEPGLFSYFADRAKKLIEDGSAVSTPTGISHTLMFPLVTAWNAGDVQAAFRESQLLQQELPSLPHDTRSLLSRQLSGFALLLGRLEEARRLLGNVPDPEQRHQAFASILFASGMTDQLRQHLASDGTPADQTTALLMAMVGLSKEAMALQGTTGTGVSASARDAVIRARVAMGEKRLDAAKADLESAVAQLTPDDRAFYFVGPDMLAMVFQKERNLTEAVRVLETTAPWRTTAAYGDTGLFWMMCQRQLARLYRDSGRGADAAHIEEQLRELLKFADDDFPLLKSLSDV